MFQPKKTTYLQMTCQMIIGVTVSLILVAICWQVPMCAGIFFLLAAAFGVGAYYSGRAMVREFQGLKPEPPRYFTAVDTPELPPVTPVVDERDDSTSLFL